MARMIRHEKTGPYRIEPEDFPVGKPMFICGCGISKNMPFCDGTHKACKSEEEGKVYRYDDGERTEIESD